MTLLYLDDQKDYLYALLSRQFDEMIVVLDEKKMADPSYKNDAFDCIVVNLKNPDCMDYVVTYRKKYIHAPLIVVVHGNIDHKACIAANVDGYILHPYEQEQIEHVVGKHIGMLNYGYNGGGDADRDRVTSVLNADSFYNKIQKAKNASLLLVDIDNFDIINTLYGLKMGDDVLIKAADYLKKMVPSNGSLHRINADEFAFFIDTPVPNQEEVLSKQIKAFFEMTHFEIKGIDFNLRVSIGIAFGKPAALLHNAKVAVKEAKDNGKNSIVVYKKTSPYLKKQQEMLYMINQIKAALEEDRVIPYFQPIFDNRTKKIGKYEALCRIENNDGEILAPGAFIDAAHVGGLITNLTRVMIDKTFKKFSTTSCSFSFNVTREDFQEGYLSAFLRKKCFFYNVDPSRVFIEIVESISFDGSDGHLDQINELSRAGYQMAIDDFGVENSNYSRLLNIEANYLKIDGKFIENVDQDINSQIIIESIVDFAQKIGAKTIAEYVNSPSVYAAICRLGVDYSQGYYIGKPQAYLVENTKIA